MKRSAPICRRNSVSAAIFDAGDVLLQSGRTHRGTRLAYQTYGTLAPARDNVILYMTPFGAHHTDIEWMIGPGRALDPTKYFIVIPNLFGNGFYAVRKRQRESGDGTFRPALRVSTRDLGEAIEIRVRDNGTGMTAEVREKLFQPFFTTKPTGEGTGLGLSISYDIVTQQHGGSIEVESEPGSHTEFTVRLPRARRATA